MSRQAWRSLSSLKVEEELAAGEGGKHQLALGGQPVWGLEVGELRASRGVSPPCVMQSGGGGLGRGGRLVKVPREGPRPSGCGLHSLLWFCRTPVLRASQRAT